MKEPSELQKLYLSKINPKLNVEFIDGATFGKNIKVKNAFFISNYCFSELSSELRDMYVKNLFPKIAHGFMCWNMIPLYNFGFNVKDELEYPSTGEFNKYIYF